MNLKKYKMIILMYVTRSFYQNKKWYLAAAWAVSNPPKYTQQQMH